MAKGYVPVYFDTLDETVEFTDEEFGRLMRAVISYAMGDSDYQRFITGNERYAFRFLKGQVDRNDEISAVRAKARVNKNDQSETKPIKPEQTTTKANKPEQTQSKSVKEKEKEAEKKKEKERLQSGFELLWDAYPKKAAKQDAAKAFMKLAPDENTLDTMLTALEKQKQSQQWREDDGRYIPHPATWLNGRRWLDQQKAEVQPLAKSTAKPFAAQNYEQRDYSDREQELRKRMIQMADELDEE